MSSEPMAARQIDDTEVRRPLIPIAEATADVRTSLEAAGVCFAADDDPGQPGLADVAAIELATGTHFAFEHHHQHPDRFVLIMAERGDGAPLERVEELVRNTPIAEANIRRVAESWDAG